MAKRRANGEGNIRKRSDGRWEGRYQELTKEEEEALIEKIAFGADNWLMDCEGCNSVLRCRDKFSQPKM